MKGKNGYAKTSIVDFPGDNWLYSHISGGKFSYIAIFPNGKLYYGKIITFPVGKLLGVVGRGGGGRYSLTAPKRC